MSNLDRSILPTKVLALAADKATDGLLIEAAKRRMEENNAEWIVVCSGDEPEVAVIRLATVVDELKAAGVDAKGEVLDPDPYLAASDAIRIYDPDEIIVSSYAYRHSGFWRRDLAGRIRDFAGVPVEHLAFDPEGQAA